MAQMLYREWFVNFRFPGHEKVKMVESEFGRDSGRLASLSSRRSYNEDRKRSFTDVEARSHIEDERYHADSAVEIIDDSQL